MTPNEALKIRKNPHFEDVDNEELSRCIDEALEKQIPKKPDTDEYEIYSNYICPNCKNIVGDYENEEHYYDFCPYCGQALDWSEKND